MQTVMAATAATEFLDSVTTVSKRPMDSRAITLSTVRYWVLGGEVGVPQYNVCFMLNTARPFQICFLQA